MLSLPSSNEAPYSFIASGTPGILGGLNTLAPSEKSKSISP